MVREYNIGKMHESLHAHPILEKACEFLEGYDTVVIFNIRLEFY
jgi:hypothetical protein